MASIDLKQETIQPSPKIVLLTISGELDETNGRQVESYFNNLIDTEKPRHVLVDLTGLAFAGSSFFGSLLFWKEELAKGKGMLVLFSLRQEIASTMRLFSLDRVITICPDRQAALDKLPSA